MILYMKPLAEKLDCWGESEHIPSLMSGYLHEDERSPIAHTKLLLQLKCSS